MTKYSKLNIVYRLQKWMDSVPGQTFLNYAYSWGASVVILGTLFKLTHLPGANVMLFLGMGTEVFVFFLSAFDRPFDKTAIGMDLPTHLEGEEEDAYEGEEGHDNSQQADTATAAMQPQAMPGHGGGPIIIGATLTSGPAAMAGTQQGDADAQPAATGAQPAAPFVTPGAPAWVASQAEASPELADAQSRYVDELNKLTDTLQKVAEQSARLTRDSEEMENLNRTLTGICKVYEMQLKGASQQIGTIDQINDQSRKMAQQIEQLNAIYTRMIEAMTVNMRAAAPGAGTGSAL